MSYCVFGNIFVGAIVKREDFFTKKDTLTWRCKEGHIRKNVDAVFCMIDGCKYFPFFIEEPTESFTKWVRENYDTDDIEDVYEHLWLMTPHSDKLGIFCVDRLRTFSSFIEKRENFIIGYVVSRTSSDDVSGNLVEIISNDYIQLKTKQVEKLLEKLNIKRSVQIFHTMEII